MPISTEIKEEKDSALDKLKGNTPNSQPTNPDSPEEPEEITYLNRSRADWSIAELTADTRQGRCCKTKNLLPAHECKIIQYPRYSIENDSELGEFTGGTYLWNMATRGGETCYIPFADILKGYVEEVKEVPVKNPFLALLESKFSDACNDNYTSCACDPESSSCLSYKNKEYISNFENDIDIPEREAKAPAEITDECKITKEKTWDTITDRRIKTLDKRLQKPAIDLINEVECELNIKLRVADALRTFEEQDELYASGRTKPGPWRTDLKGGQGFHNYGLAFDVAPIKDGVLDYNIDWSALGSIGKSKGFVWGGDWKKRDMVHFEMVFGKSWQELYAEYMKQ